MQARIGFVIGQLTVGGAEGQLFELLRHLDRRFTPTVYCLSGSAGSMAAELERLGVPVRIVGKSGLARAWRLAQMIREDAIDIVHSWLFIANGYAAASTACGRLRPLITSARNCKVQGRMSRFANRLAFRCSRRIVVNSRDVEQYIVAQYAAPRGSIQVVVNGVDPQRFRPAPNDDPTNGHPPLIVTIGRMVVQKNHDLFLGAASAVAKARADVQFMIVGDGPLRVELERKARALGLDGRLVFPGERRDTDEILRRATLFWLTSRWEGMPNVVLEAMASGVPTIATDVGGTRELVRDGVEGYIVSSEDEGAFIARTLELLQRPDQLSSFAVAARRHAEELSPQAMARSFAQLYDRILAG